MKLKLMHVYCSVWNNVLSCAVWLYQYKHTTSSISINPCISLQNIYTYSRSHTSLIGNGWTMESLVEQKATLNLRPAGRGKRAVRKPHVCQFFRSHGARNQRRLHILTHLRILTSGDILFSLFCKTCCRVFAGSLPSFPVIFVHIVCLFHFVGGGFDDSSSISSTLSSQ